MSSAFPYQIVQRSEQPSRFVTDKQTYGAFGRARAPSFPPSTALMANEALSPADLFAQKGQRTKFKHMPSAGAFRYQAVVHAIDIALLSIFTGLFYKLGRIRMNANFPETVAQLGEEGLVGPISLKASFITVACLITANAGIRVAQYRNTNANRRGMLSKSVLIAGVLQGVITWGVLGTFIGGVIAKVDRDPIDDFKIANYGFGLSMIPNLMVYSYLTAKGMKNLQSVASKLWSAKDITMNIGLLAAFVPAMCLGLSAPFSFVAGAMSLGLLVSNMLSERNVVRQLNQINQFNASKPPLFSRSNDDDAHSDGGHSMHSMGGRRSPVSQFALPGRTTPSNSFTDGDFDYYNGAHAEVVNNPAHNAFEVLDPYKPPSLSEAPANSEIINVSVPVPVAASTAATRTYSQAVASSTSADQMTPQQRIATHIQSHMSDSGLEDSRRASDASEEHGR